MYLLKMNISFLKLFKRVDYYAVAVCVIGSAAWNPFHLTNKVNNQSPKYSLNLLSSVSWLPLPSKLIKTYNTQINY